MKARWIRDEFTMSSSPGSSPPRRQWLARAAAAAATLPWAHVLHAQATGPAVAPGGAGASGAGTPASPDTTGASAQEAKAPPLPAVGTRLVLPSLDLLDGQRFEPATADGRVVLVYWWASWCPFCALTSPAVDKLWQAQRQRPAGQGMLFLPLSIDKRPEDARAYLQRRGYAWPAAWVSPAVHRALPKPKGLPVTLVRGRDGRLLQAEAGQLFPEDVEALARHA